MFRNLVARSQGKVVNLEQVERRHRQGARLIAFEQQELEFHGRVLELAHPKVWESWFEPMTFEVKVAARR